MLIVHGRDGSAHKLLTCLGESRAVSLAAVGSGASLLAHTTQPGWLWVHVHHPPAPSELPHSKLMACTLPHLLQCLMAPEAAAAVDQTPRIESRPQLGMAPVGPMVEEYLGIRRPLTSAEDRDNSFGAVLVHDGASLGHLLQLLSAEVATPDLVEDQNHQPASSLRTIYQVALSQGHLDAASTVAWLALLFGQLGRCMAYWTSIGLWDGSAAPPFSTVLDPRPCHALLVFRSSSQPEFDSSQKTASGAQDLALVAAVSRDTAQLITLGWTLWPVAWSELNGPQERVSLLPLHLREHPKVGALLEEFRQALSVTQGAAPLYSLSPDLSEEDAGYLQPQSHAEMWCLDRNVEGASLPESEDRFAYVRDVQVGADGRCTAVLAPGITAPLSSSSLLDTAPAVRRTWWGNAEAPHLAVHPMQGARRELSDYHLAKKLAGVWAVYNNDSESKPQVSYAYCMVMDADSHGYITGMNCPWSTSYPVNNMVAFHFR